MQQQEQSRRSTVERQDDKTDLGDRSATGGTSAFHSYCRRYFFSGQEQKTVSPTFSASNCVVYQSNYRGGLLPVVTITEAAVEFSGQKRSCPG